LESRGPLDLRGAKVLQEPLDLEFKALKVIRVLQDLPDLKELKAIKGPKAIKVTRA
jgi:hypothetical protein